MKREINAQLGSKPSALVQPILYSPKIVQPNGVAIISQVPAQLTESEPIELRARNLLPSLTFNPALINQLQNFISKGQDKSGVLFGTNPSRSKRFLSFCLQFANPILHAEQEDIHCKISQQQCFCACFQLSKARGDLPLEKFRYEMKRCLETIEYPHDEVILEEQNINQLEKLYFQLMRVFLSFSLAEEQLHRAVFFPNVNLLLRETKLRCKYADNNVLRQLLQPISNLNTIVPTFGYLVPDDKNRIAIDSRGFVNFSKPSVPVIGVWAYARDIKKKDSYQLNPEKLHLVWALIVDYIRRDNLQKYSLFGQNKGLFIIFTPGESKPTVFIFECKQESTSNRWAFSKSSSKTLDFNETVFDTLVLEDNLQDIFSSEEKEPPLRKQISSPPKKEVSQPAPRRQFPSFSNNSFAKSQADSLSVKEISDRVSQKSYDERDVQIQVLKKTLQFYKKRCEELESKCQQLDRELIHRNQQQQFIPFYHPMVNHQMQQLGQMASMAGPINMPPTTSPINSLHHSGIAPGYFPLYHSNIGPHPQYGMPIPQQQQPFQRSNVQSFNGNSMSQSYVVMSREEFASDDKFQEEQLDSAFTKKQHTVDSNKEATNINGNYATPVHRLGSNAGFSKPDLRINLAEQFSNDSSSPNNENSNFINRPSKIEGKEEPAEDSPKFQLGEMSEPQREESKGNNSSLMEIIEEPKQAPLEMSFKGYMAAPSIVSPILPPTLPTSNIPTQQPKDSPLPRVPLPKSVKIPQNQSKPAPIAPPEIHHKFMESFSSDNERTINSAFVENVIRPSRSRVQDSDEEDDYFKNICSKYVDRTKS